MSEQTVQVQDASPSSKNMRTIQQTAGGNTVQSEVVILATGAANGGDTYDARQIRTLTTTDIVSSVLNDGAGHNLTVRQLNVNSQAADYAVTVKLGALGTAAVGSTIPVTLASTTANQGSAGATPWLVTGNRTEGAAPVGGAHQSILTTKDASGNLQFLNLASSPFGIAANVLPVAIDLSATNFGGNASAPIATTSAPQVSAGFNLITAGNVAPASGSAAFLGRGSAIITGTWSGVLVLDVSFDNGATYTQLTNNPIFNWATGQWQNSITASGIYSFSMPGNNAYQVRASVMNSGTATCSIMNSTTIDDIPRFAGVSTSPAPTMASLSGAADPTGLLQPLHVDSYGRLQVSELRGTPQILKGTWGPGWGNFTGW